jgi:hypothetical protein
LLPFPAFPQVLVFEQQYDVSSQLFVIAWLDQNPVAAILLGGGQPDEASIIFSYTRN